MSQERMNGIEGRVRSFEEINEKLIYLREELKNLENAQREIRQWLYQARPKEYAKDALGFLKSNKGKYPGAIRLIDEIESWLSQYDKYIDERIKRFSPKELFRFKLVDEIMKSLPGNKTLTVEKVFKFLSENRDANEKDIRDFLQTFKDNGERIKSYCPYCTNEIDPKVNKCPSCGVTFGPDTLKSLRVDFEESEERDSEKQENETKGSHKTESE